MDGKSAIKHINMYIQNYLPCDGILYACIGPAIAYMRTLPNDPDSIYLLNFIEEAKTSLLNTLSQINYELTYRNIKDEQVFDYYIRSKIPFKSETQYFFLALFCCYADESTHNMNMFRPIYHFLLSNKFINSPSLCASLDRKLSERYMYYDVWQNKNREDDDIKNILLRNNYITGGCSVSTPFLQNEIGLVGYCAEQEFFNNAIKNLDKDEFIIWVSRHVNKYESLDFIVYNFRRQFARIHEIKGTTNNDICMATITRSEEKVLDEVLASKNKIYEVDRIKLDPNLKGIDDYSAFRFFSKGNLDYLDINGYRKGGVGMVMGHDEKTMLGSNFAHVFETFANNQGPTRTR